MLDIALNCVGVYGPSVSASKTQDEGFRGSTTCRRAVTLIRYLSRRRVKLGFRDSVVAVLSSGWLRSAPAGFPGEDGADLCCTLQVDAQSSAGPEIPQIRTSQTHHSGRSASKPWKKNLLLAVGESEQCSSPLFEAPAQEPAAAKCRGPAPPPQRTSHSNLGRASKVGCGLGLYP